MDRQTDVRTDICTSKVAFMTENLTQSSVCVLQILSLVRNKILILVRNKIQILVRIKILSLVRIKIFIQLRIKIVY